MNHQKNNLEALRCESEIQRSECLTTDPSLPPNSGGPSNPPPTVPPDPLAFALVLVVLVGLLKK
jgi:hypothetical protein